MSAVDQVCSGKNCGKPAVYAVKVEYSGSKFFYCERCRGEFAASLEKVPEDRRVALLKEIVITPLAEVSNAS